MIDWAARHPASRGSCRGALYSRRNVVFHTIPELFPKKFRQTLFAKHAGMPAASHYDAIPLVDCANLAIDGAAISLDLTPFQILTILIWLQK
jgi:hypothetical protein